MNPYGTATGLRAIVAAHALGFATIILVFIYGRGDDTMVFLNGSTAARIVLRIVLILGYAEVCYMAARDASERKGVAFGAIAAGSGVLSLVMMVGAKVTYKPWVHYVATGVTLACLVGYVSLSLT
jgi:hypothetical protein